jgi:hypothetical protein
MLANRKEFPLEVRMTAILALSVCQLWGLPPSHQSKASVDITEAKERIPRLPQALTLPPPSSFPIFPSGLITFHSHEVGTVRHMRAFSSVKHLGIIDTDQVCLEGNRTECREGEASSAVIKTSVGLLSVATL